MQVIVKTTPDAKAPLSEVARFVAADIKGGESAHNYRMAVISKAILEGYKGNPNNLTEAAGFAVGKSKKAKAYQAAFTALPTITKAPYVGKWDAATNAEVRAEVAKLCAAAEFEFESAFLLAMDSAAAEAAAKRAELKAKADAEAAAAAAAAAEASSPDEAEASSPAPAAQPVELDIGELVDTVTTAIQQGMLSQDEVIMLRLALAGMDEKASGPHAASMAAIAGMGSDSVLLTAQAH